MLQSISLLPRCEAELTRSACSGRQDRSLISLSLLPETKHLNGMVGNALGRRARLAQAQTAQAEAPQFERVIWWKDSGLLKLYFWCAILMVSSASTGFDA